MFPLYGWLGVVMVEMVLGNPLAAGVLQHPTHELWIVEDRSQLEPRTRVRRQLNNYGSDAGTQIINDIFQIPIQTLTVVSKLFLSTRAHRNQRRRNTNNNSNNNNNADSNSGYTAYSSSNNNNAYSSNNNNAYSSSSNAYSSKPNAYYTTDSNGQNDGYSDVYSRPNRYTSSNGYNRPYNYFYENSSGNRYSSRKSAAEIARLSVAKDGSSYKI